MTLTRRQSNRVIDYNQLLIIEAISQDDRVCNGTDNGK